VKAKQFVPNQKQRNFLEMGEGSVNKNEDDENNLDLHRFDFIPENFN
jgi:hypothetical protein